MYFEKKTNSGHHAVHCSDSEKYSWDSDNLFICFYSTNIGMIFYINIFYVEGILFVWSFASPSPVKFVKSFATWQHLAVSRGLSCRLRYTCSGSASFTVFASDRKTRLLTLSEIIRNMLHNLCFYLTCKTYFTVCYWCHVSV